jgi:hypothetical protein
MEPKSQRQRIFGVTLDEVMRTQSRMHPQAELPVILTTLIEAIKTLRVRVAVARSLSCSLTHPRARSQGPETEGIFRISANKSEIDAMHRAFDAGNYEVKSASPHAPAGLLKEWLRELAEPLIPDEGACARAGAARRGADACAAGSVPAVCRGGQAGRLHRGEGAGALEHGARSEPRRGQRARAVPRAG